MNRSNTIHQFSKVFGPGLLLAAVTVGVSHLVQSTRAGAIYGFAMLVFIVIAIATKYPTYLFAPRYTQTTGVSVVDGFRRQGPWALVLFAIIFPIPGLVGVAAVMIITAGIAQAFLDLSASPAVISVFISFITAALLISGRYHWLDLIMKLLMLVLSVTTIIAAVMIIPYIDWQYSWKLYPDNFDMRTILFTAALFGWMPGPLESTVNHSLWLKAKIQDTGYRPNAAESSLDFHIGYFLTLLLAICFLMLGTGVMHGKGLAFEESAGGFAAQIIALYTQTLGEWSRPLIGISALAVVYSTVLAATDGYSRIAATIVSCFKGPETPAQNHTTNTSNSLYICCVVIFSSGSLCIIMFLMSSFKTLIDIATTLSFLTTPILAFLIHRCIMSNDIPQEVKPGRFLWFYSLLCIGILTAFAAGYIFLITVR